MHTREILIDIHARAHESLALLMNHCEGMAVDEVARELDGFGYPTILRQLHHIIGAERYWVSVLSSNMDASEDEADWASIEAVREFRDRTTPVTLEYLKSRSDEELSRALDCKTWRGDTQSLVPARVIVRTQTHLFHHQGQVSAMCRLLGSPVPPGFDYPIE